MSLVAEESVVSGETESRMLPAKRRFCSVDILFVNLGIGIQHLPNHITVFGFDIALYGIIIGMGAILGLMLSCQDFKSRGQDSGILVDYMIFAILFAIVGARLYYVIFAWDSYRNNLWEIFNIRKGGMAIYGGIIGAALTLIVFARVKKVPFFRIADSAVLGLLLGQMIGRWGNFFNCEAFGGYTDNLFAMRIRMSLVNPSMITQELLERRIIEDGVTYIQVHPTFLYESMWNAGLLILLYLYRKHKRFEGELFWLYFVGYGIGRFWIEALRTDQLKLFATGMAVSQLLSLIMAAAALLIIIVNRKITAKVKEN